MAYEMKDGGGTIFRNKFKKDGDNAPNMRGKVMWRGEEIEIALWTKETPTSGGKFFSVKLQEPRDKQDKITTAPQRMNARPASAEMDDEIPF